MANLLNTLGGMIKKFIYILFFYILISTSCQKLAKLPNTKQNYLTKAQVDSIKSDIKFLLDNLPNPYELEGVDNHIYYNPKILNDITNIKIYINEGQKAVNLGIYIVDLAYIMFYKDTLREKIYLAIVRKLAKNLNFQNILGDTLLNKFVLNAKKPDLIVELLKQTYSQILEDFYNSKKLDLAALTITGAWIESFYISLKIETIENAPFNKDINKKLSEQRIILKKLLNLLSHFKDNEIINEIFYDLKDIELMYENFGKELTFNDINRLLIRLSFLRSYLIKFK